MADLDNPSSILTDGYMPRIFRLQSEVDKVSFQQLLMDKNPTIIDEIYHQINELVALRFPEKMGRPSEDEMQNGIARELNGVQLQDYGAWVYFPWRNTVVHLLDEEAFIEVRTNRNKLKITGDEQALLKTKVIGIIGMSVGSGAALAIAMERGAGELRIADMDTLDLSNLNRIRSSVLNLRLPKTTIVAREIAEIDPYLKVKVFDCGVDENNIEDFFTKDGTIHALIELCDSVKIKLLARLVAKKKRIPVIMETSDRGTLDVERYDLDPNLGILHGRFTDQEVENLLDNNAWSPEITSKFMAPNELSKEMLISLKEMGKTISRWPQTGSEVTMGAGVAAAVVRKILLGDSNIYGRKFIDIDELYMD